MQLLIGLLGQVETASIPEKRHLLSLIWHADPVVKLTILILFIFSIVCWAIIANKYRQFKRSEDSTEQFLSVFWKTQGIEEVALKRNQKSGPAYRIFETAAESPKNIKAEILKKNIRRTFDGEIERLEYGIPFLATTASAAPFIGLFGTVWGILTAFFKIGQAGTSSIAVVGPHIAEALIATAIGLAAAIPATVFYNIFVARIRKFSKTLENFTDDLIERLH